MNSPRPWPLLQTARTLLDMLYPRSCVVCGSPMPGDPFHVCWDCRARFVLIEEPYCRRCGDPVEGTIGHDYTCSICRRAEPHFDLARSALRYRSSMCPALHAYKYRRLTCLSRDFGQYLGACLSLHFSGIPLDAVTSVPLYSMKQRERTFNQSTLLARRVAAQAGLFPFFRCLRRVKCTCSQTGLMAGERRRNVRDAFRAVCPDWIEGRALLLIDDVMTTGATVNECARVLKEAGAAGVYVLTLARG